MLRAPSWVMPAKYADDAVAPGAGISCLGKEGRDGTVFVPSSPARTARGSRRGTVAMRGSSVDHHGSQDALMARVLFVCRQNAGRSQMSRAFFEQVAGDRHAARSAGTAPAACVHHPEVVEVMREVGIDIVGRTPQRLTDEAAEWAEVVVTMGCGDQCPYIPGKTYIEWELPDPQGLPLPEIRRVRDEIYRRVRALVHALDVASDQPLQ
jgi:arsenate reductase